MTWRTLTELLAYNAESYSNFLFLRFLKRGEVVDTCTFAQTWERASRWAALFSERGLRPGEAVVLAMPNTDDFVYAYFGTLLAGGAPAPSTPIRRLKSDSHYLKNVVQRLHSIDARFLVVPESQVSIADTPPLSEFEQLTLLSRRDVQPTTRCFTPTGSGEDIGLLQFTSGTSGNSKVVQLSNAALLAQMCNLAAKIKLDHEQDSGVTWLPVFHDMGMIGFLLTPMIGPITINLLLTEDFMMRPNLWIKALSDLQGTITAGPPSAYALCARHLKEAEIEQYDLSRVRIALAGAEVVTQHSLQQFSERLRPTGFRPTSLVSAYGLAENCLAVTMTSPDEGPEFETIDLEMMTMKGIAQPAQHLNGVSGRPQGLTPQHTATRAPTYQNVGAGDPAWGAGNAPALATRVVASVGTPLPQTRVAIVSATGEMLGERQVGEVLISSPSLMQGYYGQPEASSQALRDGWLWTGDLGYIADGKLYITGRKKEVLIVGGRNYYPDDLEQVAGAAAGVRLGNAVAIAYEDLARATEAVVVLVETSATEQATRDALRQRVRQALVEAEYPISEVVLLRPRTIQTTMNGKLKRVECKVRYLKGEFADDN